MEFGLSPATVEKIRSALARFPQVERAVVYGSRAMGNYKRGSDIDLVLMGEGLTHSHLCQIADVLDDLLLPYMIDLALYAQIRNPDLLEHILRVGLTFYERQNAESGGLSGAHLSSR